MSGRGESVGAVKADGVRAREFFLDGRGSGGCGRVTRGLSACRMRGGLPVLLLLLLRMRSGGARGGGVGRRWGEMDGLEIRAGCTESTHRRLGVGVWQWRR